MSETPCNELEVVNIRLVKEPSLYSEWEMSSPEAVVNFMAKEMSHYDREVFCILNMNTRMQIINMNVVSIGTINTCEISIRELFKSSILANASSIIAIHNHPSGNIAPSHPDMLMTKKIAMAGKLMGIPLTDHIIVGGVSGKYTSFLNDNLFDFEQAVKQGDLGKMVKKEQDLER